MNLNHKLKLFFKIFITLFTIWFVGLLIFIYKIPTKNFHYNHQETDAVIILTGCHTRIEKGIQIFAKSSAEKLLISGVGEGVTKKDLYKIVTANQLEDKIKPERIVISNIAYNTISNAHEAKLFMDVNNYKSLRLITSDYHMARSHLLFKYLMPDIKVIIHPIITIRLKKEGSFFSHEALKIIIVEYNKFLATPWILMKDLLSFFEVFNS